MPELLTLQLPEELAGRARALAKATHRSVEDAIVDWISQAVSQPDVRALSNDQLLEYCSENLPENEQCVLSELLADQREGQLTIVGRRQLELLLDKYRRGLIWKSAAIREAVARGIKPSLDEHAA